MKIALIYDRVYPWLKGGGEKTLWDIACQLRELGHEVHYFGTKLWDGNDRIVRDGIVLHGVSRRAKFYNADGRRSIFQPLIFSAGLFRSLWRMRNADFNLINCTVFPFFSVFAVWLFRALCRRRIPWVLTWLEVWGAHYWREYLGSNVAGAIGYAIEWVCARCCAEHLMISLLHARRMSALLGVDPDRIHVIARGTDIKKISSLSKSIPKQRRVLYVGRLLPYKNVETVVRAWPLIVQRFPEVKLRIIGAGPSGEELAAIARASKIDIELFPPHENWDEIIREIAAAEVLVQPSIREGQSVVAIEAMAARTVVIAARHQESAVSDFIRHGDNGLLIDDWNNPQTWAAAITLLLNDADERARLAQAALHTAARFDWNTRLVPQLSMFFTQLASAGKCEREISDTPCPARH